jgi:hypothetical protein
MRRKSERTCRAAHFFASLCALSVLTRVRPRALAVAAFLFLLVEELVTGRAAL